MSEPVRVAGFVAQTVTNCRECMYYRCHFDDGNEYGFCCYSGPRSKIGSTMTSSTIVPESCPFNNAATNPIHEANQQISEVLHEVTWYYKRVVREVNVNIINTLLSNGSMRQDFSVYINEHRKMEES